ncbi:hypothetical protein QL996_07750 [Planococcus sp. APC 4015]|nr:hypothetical protein [Planococcus sp. APC 4015]
MESKDILNELDADRTALAKRVKTPWWLAGGFGLMAVTFVISPAFGGNANGVIISSVVMAIALIAVYRARTGIKIAGSGTRPWLIVLSGLVIVLALFSVSLGLASLGLSWWIALPTLAAFAAVASLTFLFTRVVRERIRHVR